MIQISDQKLQEKIKFSPHSKQLKILESDAQDIVICAGRRFGKSAVCGYIGLKQLLLPNQKIWIVSPTYELSKKVFEYLVKWYIQSAPPDAKNRWMRGISYRPIPQIKTPWGSIVQCKSADSPAGLLGEELDLLIVDECSRLKRNIYETYLFATTASRKGRTFFISTPYGKNWFYEKWLEAKNPDNKIGAAFHFPSQGCPGMPDSQWEKAKVSLPQQTFEQEYQAIFISDAASVFRSIHDIVVADLYQNPIHNHQYSMGVDLAKHRDFTVITVMDKSKFPHPVVYWDRFNKIDFNFQKARILEVAKKYNNARITLDSTAIGSPISDDLKRAGCLVEDFTFSRKSKPELVEKLSINIEQQKIRIPDETTIIDELGAYAYQMTDSGNITYGAPEGLHDDCVMSLALAVWSLRGRAVKRASTLSFNQQHY